MCRSNQKRRTGVAAGRDAYLRRIRAGAKGILGSHCVEVLGRHVRHSRVGVAGLGAQFDEPIEGATHRAARNAIAAGAGDGGPAQLHLSRAADGRQPDRCRGRSGRMLATHCGYQANGEHHATQSIQSHIAPLLGSRLDAGSPERKSARWRSAPAQNAWSNS